MNTVPLRLVAQQKPPCCITDPKTWAEDAGRMEDSESTWLLSDLDGPDVVLTKSSPACWALAMPNLYVLLYALVAEEMVTLHDHDLLWAVEADAALEDSLAIVYFILEPLYRCLPSLGCQLGNLPVPLC